MCLWHIQWAINSINLLLASTWYTTTYLPGLLGKLDDTKNVRNLIQCWPRMSPHPDSTPVCLDLFPSLLYALEKGNGNPLQYACLGNRMACCSPWGHKELDNDLATKSPPPLSAFVVVSSLSCVQLFVTPWTAARQASLSFTISQSLLKFMPLSQWCYLNISSATLFSFVVQSSQHQDLFWWVGSSHQVAKY